MERDSENKPVRHVLSLSGGKDSSALAVYLRDRIENLEYVFCDTEKELPETYDYLDKLEAFLGREIIYIKNKIGFDKLLESKGGFLPSAQERWCTEYLKIKPFEDFLGEKISISYIGIRADELHRKGYISNKKNIIPKYPFIEDGINKMDVERILHESGLGFPEYYKWRSRSGCYFCFFQKRIEWVGLFENHRDLFMQAMDYEKINEETGQKFTWSSVESLSDLIQPERIKHIKNESELFEKETDNDFSEQSLINIFNKSDIYQKKKSISIL